MRQNTKHEGQKKGSRRRRTADGRDKLMRENRNTKDKSRGGVGGQPTGGTNPGEKLKTSRTQEGERRRTADWTTYPLSEAAMSSADGLSPSADDLRTAADARR